MPYERGKRFGGRREIKRRGRTKRPPVVPASGLVDPTLGDPARGPASWRRRSVASRVLRESTAPALRDEAAHWHRRLHDGLVHNISLVIGKAVLGATAAGVRPTLMALADLLLVLDNDDRYLALFYGAAAVADDCEGQPPRTDTEPLGGNVPFETLARWFRHWVRVRHRSGAERTLRTALADFADGGHALDFLEKAFEATDLLGWQSAKNLLPSIVPVLTTAIGSEEMDSWRHPMDLVALAERALHHVPEALRAGRRQRGSWRQHARLGRAVLGEDPETILQALVRALRDGASPADVARAVAFAAALRIAHFGTSNDHSDWESAHHTFSYANAAFGLFARATDSGVDVEAEALCLRAAFHGALAVYLDRYLNVPPARLPPGDAQGVAPAELRRAFPDACDRQQQVAEATRLAAAYLLVGHPHADFIALLGHTLLREDVGFHMVQNLQAAVRQHLAWEGDPEAAPILIAPRRPFSDAPGAPSDRPGRPSSHARRRGP
jgi:hypothetical protein